MSPVERLFAVRDDLYLIRDVRSDANDYARGYATGQIALALKAITTAAFILDAQEAKRLSELDDHADGA
jgi:hypothetical protein